MRLAVLRNLVKEILPKDNHIFVILQVEAAFQHVIVCKGLKPVVLSGKEEPFCGILEVSLGVVDVTKDVVRWC